ncbi:AMP-binding protein, partial [Streptomyces cyaneofuscatus]|uniref:AMP-binding protein n=2 Tax=Streptomyces TaxID=1883 RepID=UPI0005157863
GVSFRQLVDGLGVGRDLSTSPLVQAVLALQSVDAGVPAFGGVAVERMDVPHRVSPFDLRLVATVDEGGGDAGAGGLRGFLEFSTDVFEAGTAERLLGFWRCVLEELAFGDLDRLAGSVPLMGADERRVLLEKFGNAGGAAVELAGAGGLSLVGLFDCSCELFPDRVALSFGERELTYRELDAASRRVAHRLSVAGVGAGDMVGLWAGPGFELVIGMLAVLRVGAAYVPVSPELPTERAEHVLADSGAVVLLSAGRGWPEHPNVVLLEGWESGPLAPVVPVADDSAAYVIYTSGTTGSPKGVVIEHRNVVRLFTHGVKEYGLGPEDVWTLFHSYS